jgi:hypothetical protein
VREGVGLYLSIGSGQQQSQHLQSMSAFLKVAFFSFQQAPEHFFVSKGEFFLPVHHPSLFFFGIQQRSTTLLFFQQQLMIPDHMGFFDFLKKRKEKKKG